MKHSLITLLYACLPAAAISAPVDYARDVKPLLAEHCYKCHGATQQKNGLRLDTATDALKGGEHGAGFKPGRSADSLIMHVVKGRHPDLAQMPYKRAPLSESQVATLAAWIDEGATAPASEQPESARHWAFIPPARPTVPPATNAAARIRNPIDAFIAVRLEEEQIAPSPEADPVTLIRRLSLDLTGLPPAPADVDAFVNDTRPDAYGHVVERLLASPHYGERWGRHWLDVARYADSNGYSIDAPRSIWKYRDWVIDALNRDLPFTRFTVEQLAGDMLPDATPDQKIATGFHRNTQINQEGGIDKEQFRIESIIDRVNTTGTAFLGLTIGCCQCHDHKFDPLTQNDFYGLFAFLNNADEPDLPVTSPVAATTMVMQERAQPRRTYLFIKGDFTRDGGTIVPAVPAVLHPLEKKESPNRLDLAKWLVDPRNPLIARVTVNRLWQQYFGRGIVETENDFGTQGAPPSHPELLDWLATEFMAQNWSLKAMHRLIVHSSTYRQSSRARPELQEIDPNNKFLARQNRLRLDAEIVRDVALSASGLLDARIGGPGVYPPIPEGVLSLGQSKQTWKVSTGGDRYRRGLYTFFFRATAPPALAVFDAPDAFSACTRRLRSNTPLQALTLLNDRQFYELAQGLAARILSEGPKADSDRLEFAFRLCLARAPTPGEKHTLLPLLAQPPAAGENPGGAAKGAEAAELAAWTTIARVLLNLDETITRE